MSKRFGLMAAGGLAVALVAGGGTALAASSGPVSSAGVITGCYTNADVNGSHALVLQDAGTTCPKGTSAVSWDQTGPAGAQGPQGPQGPAGSTGATGPTGPAGASIVTSQGVPSNPCTSGDTDVDLADGEVYTCTASAWTDTDSSIQGPSGPAGAAGPQGPAGPAGSGGGITAVTDLNGLTCTAPDGSAGTITLTTAGSFPEARTGVITLTCTAGAAFNCIHSNGVGQAYTDCQNALGNPGGGSIYNEDMALEAAQAYLNSLPAGSGDTIYSGSCQGGAEAEIDVLPPGSYSPIYSWFYATGNPSYGFYAGDVSTDCDLGAVVGTWN